MPDLNIKFDRHGLGDCVHFAHALQLYKSRGFDVTVQAEENKLFVWKVAGVNIVQGGGLPDHPYIYPAGFDDLDAADHERNKVAFGLRHDVMPRLEALGLSQEQVWDELCAVRLAAHDHIPPEAHAEAERFLEGLPRPIICFHSRGTNWHERKSLPTDVAFDVILKLLEQTGGSVIVLDFDHRAPMVGHERCKGIKPNWGHIGIDRLCALYERSDLMIGVDSGPLHVASFTNIKTLGVFRSLHPNRVCLPNPNAVYLVSDRHWQALSDRGPRWRYAQYFGEQPTADDVVSEATLLLKGSPHMTQHDKLLERFAGRYIYNRVGHDHRPMELMPNGTIGDGRQGCEQQWSASTENGVAVITISGKDGVICHCRCCNDGVFRGAWIKFERMPIELAPLKRTDALTPVKAVAPLKDVTSLAGTYTYRRIWHEDRPMTLLPGGAIEGSGPSDCEQTWELCNGVLAIAGKAGVICRLNCSKDGVWRGRWNQYERMPIEMVPEGSDFQQLEQFHHVEMLPARFEFLRYEDLIKAVRQFCTRLECPRAVAGVPRAGALVAALIAEHFAIPIIDLDEALSPSPYIPDQRRPHGSGDNSSFILVVDDTVWGGRTMSYIRSRRVPGANVRFACVYATPENRHLVDYFYAEHPRALNMFEWNMLREPWADKAICDLDGVLSADWTGGDEVTNSEGYERHINDATVLYRPTHSVGAIVTGRVEAVRKQTEAWLRKNDIRYNELIMFPGPTSERDVTNIGRWKGEVYRSSSARVFFESDYAQAQTIQRTADKPVVWFPERLLLQ